MMQSFVSNLARTRRPLSVFARSRLFSSSSSSSPHSHTASPSEPASPLPPTTPTPQLRAPGDKHEVLDSMLRVDHAGEYGAVRIYEGQLAVLGKTAVGDQLREMLHHEQVHLDALQRIMPERRVRPTALLPVWHVAGFALGAASAALGPKAAMACTVAVEEVISEHYNNQLRQLHQREDSKNEDELRQLIAKHRDEELEHRDIGLRHDALNAPFYSAFTSVIKAGCHAAIWVAQRV